MALVAVFGIAYRYAQALKIDPVSNGILSLASFILLTPSILSKDGIQGIGFNFLGASGLFAAILVSLVSTKIFQ